MRLVDADAFIEFIRNLPKTENGYSRAYDESDIIHYINEQPTAYDVEKAISDYLQFVYDNASNEEYANEDGWAMSDLIDLEFKYLEQLKECE